MDSPRHPCRTRRNTRKRPHVSSRSGSHVLVVDSEPVIASRLTAILRINGFSARFFTCPLEALAAARSELHDLVKAHEHRKIANDSAENTGATD